MKTKKLLFYFPFYAALVCIVRELLPLLTEISGQGVNSGLSLFLNSLFLRINFSLVNLLGWFSIYADERIVNVNMLNVTLFIVTLAGAILYMISKGRESRIVRFSLSLYIFWGIVGTVFNLIFIFLHRGEYFAHVKIATSITGFIFTLFWVWISWLALKEIDRKRFENGQVLKNGEGSGVNHLESPRIQRFVHWLTDLYISLFVCSNFLIGFGLNYWSNLEHQLGQKSVLYIFTIVSMLIWYLFFEILFGATPSKILTESRVVMTDGSRVTIKAVLIRTLSRFVPFEPFSFLWGEKGWHDNWSKTMVVKETGTGVKASKYWLLIPFIVLIALIEYGSVQGYKKYLEIGNQKTLYKNEIEVLENELAHLSLNQVFLFLDVKSRDYFEGEYRYAKVSKIEGNMISLSVFKTPTYLYYDLDVEKSWLENGNEANTVMITIDELHKAYSRDYRTFIKRKQKGIDLLGDMKRYYLRKVYRIFETVFQDRHTGSWYGNAITIDFTNPGHGADLVAIENTIGNMKWLNELPQQVKPQAFGNVAITLSAADFDRDGNYQFKAILKDSLGALYEYRMDINKNKRKMIRVY